MPTHMTQPCAVVLVALLFCYSSLVMADAGWTGKGQLNSLTTSDYARIVIEAYFPDPVSDCRDEMRFYIDLGRPGSPLIHELLLAALVAQKPVQLKVTGKCELKGISEISATRIAAE